MLGTSLQGFESYTSTATCLVYIRALSACQYFIRVTLSCVQSCSKGDGTWSTGHFSVNRWGFLSCRYQKSERMSCSLERLVVLDTHPASVNNGLDAPAPADICLHSWGEENKMRYREKNMERKIPPGFYVGEQSYKFQTGSRMIKGWAEGKLLSRQL